jgi:phosphoribosylformylglycinamidine synthase subunit PurS
VPRVIVDVMPKPEILDPQGKRFELEVDEADEATLAEVREIAETLLSNPVIEDYSVRVEEQQ